MTAANTIWQQIEVGVKMSLGARNAAVKNDGETLVMQVSSVRQLWVSITHNASDYYDIACWQNKKINGVPTEVIKWVATDVDCFQLNGELLRLEREVWGQ